MEVELPAYQRLRTALVLIDVYLIVSGIVDVAIGAVIASDMPSSDSELQGYKFPVIWLVGLPFLLSGFLGLLSVYKSTKFWTVTWVLISTATNGAVFIYVAVSHQMEPEVFGVNLNVYGKCSEDNGKLCLCKLPHQSALGVLYTSCESVWWRTTLFLILVSIFTIGLATLIIAQFLALTVSFWLPRCVTKNEVDLRMYSTYTSYYGAETTCLNDVTSTAMEPTTTTSRQPLLETINSSTAKT